MSKTPAQWTLEKRHLPLKFDWKISRNSTSYKENFFVRFRFNDIEGMGEVAPNIRYGETPDKIEDDFMIFLSEARKFELGSLIQVHNLLKSLPLCHSLKFGIESAFTHFLCQVQKKSIHEFFNLPKPTNVYTSFSMPIMEIGGIKDFLEPLKSYKSLKIKVNQETGKEMLEEIAKYSNQALRVDANEAWTNVDDLMKFIEAFPKNNPIDFIEQPMPAHKKDDYKELFKRCPHTLIGDESVEDTADFSELKLMFHGINMKLMKAGSFLTGINLLKEAKRNNMKTMIGCMVETSLGIKAAYEISSLGDFLDLDGFLLLKNDPFHYLNEKDGLITLVNEGEAKI
ncbi:MAG: enolase C-terminal domain-like protein [Bacteriovoracaceae bacterium]